MARSRKRKKPRVWAHPYAIVLAYQQAMRGYSRTLRANVAGILIPRIAGIAAEAYAFRPDELRADDTPLQVDPLLVSTAAGTWYGRLTASLNDLLGSMDDHSRQLWEIARAYGRDTADFNGAQFHATVRRVLSVDVFKAEPWLVPELAAWEAENLRLIRSIPVDAVARLQGSIVQGLREGQSATEIEDAVRGVADITENRAVLIARDQVSKLNGQLTRYRQQGIGVTEFVWRGVLDSRERPEHVALEGRVCSWADPPEGGPGMPINCRCWSEAIIPELADIDGMVVP